MERINREAILALLDTFMQDIVYMLLEGCNKSSTSFKEILVRVNLIGKLLETEEFLAHVSDGRIRVPIAVTMTNSPLVKRFEDLQQCTQISAGQAESISAKVSDLIDKYFDSVY